ncbi:MAG TPA: DUF6491 family protein [Steroidobacteraceae bacterium]|nr:DUF6491 family protein [Steroidobacteraceae bacterium]
MNPSAIRIAPRLLGLAAGAWLAASGAWAADAPPAAGLQKEEASIPFVNHRNIRDWQADKDQGLWIQDERRNWYYAKLLGPCINLDWALSVGFETGGASATLDKFSAVVVPDEGFSRGNHQRCQFTSLTRSDPPPPKQKSKQKGVNKEAVKDQKQPYSI